MDKKKKVFSFIRHKKVRGYTLFTTLSLLLLFQFVLVHFLEDYALKGRGQYYLLYYYQAEAMKERAWLTLDETKEYPQHISFKKGSVKMDQKAKQLHFQVLIKGYTYVFIETKKEENLTEKKT